jgi:hypothetical protein
VAGDSSARGPRPKGKTLRVHFSVVGSQVMSFRPRRRPAGEAAVACPTSPPRSFPNSALTPYTSARPETTSDPLPPEQELSQESTSSRSKRKRARDPEPSRRCSKLVGMFIDQATLDTEDGSDPGGIDKTRLQPEPRSRTHSRATLEHRSRARRASAMSVPTTTRSKRGRRHVRRGDAPSPCVDYCRGPA